MGSALRQMITLKNVTKTYHTRSERVTVLEDISLTIDAHTLTSIIGPSGAGKTTLLQVIGLLDPLTSGELWIDGVNIDELSEKEKFHLRQHKISYIFQQFQLLPALTAIENVMLPVLQFKKKKDVLERATYLLEKVGLSHRSHHAPAKLSGGEQQRIAIARALMNDPDIILADELTGNLDEETTTYVMDFLQDIQQRERKTIVMVTHNLDLMTYTDQVFRLENGRLCNSYEDHPL